MKRTSAARRGGRFRLALVGLTAMVAAAAGLSIARQATPPAEPVATTATPGPAATTYDPSFHVPEGKIPVAFDDGGKAGLAGFMDEVSQDMETPWPELGLGSGRYPSIGWEVTDAGGLLVGYYVSTLGFVDLATARDPAAVDARFAAVEALNAEHPFPGLDPDDVLAAG